MDVESLFERFRRTGDPAVLGQVFDLVADDLFGVALHLSRDWAEAEDLLQQTFLAAIENAKSYDSSRPLRAWLLGILHNMARRQRSARHRTADAGRVRKPEARSPVEALLASETREQVTEALGAIPEPYRQVLELHLLHALPNEEIAARLQRSPGAVRTQIWRGLAMLRKALPVGLAGLLASQPSLAAVRARVLSAAGKATAASASIATASGVLFMKSVTLVAVAACTVGLVWFLWPNREPSRDLPAVESPLGQALADGDRDLRVTSQAAQRRSIVPEAEKQNPQPRPSAASATIARLLLVDSAGDPVPGAEISLFEPAWRVRDGKRTVEDHRAPGSPFHRTTADASGRCRVAIAQLPCYLNAAKDGVGTSGDLLVQPDMPELRSEWRVILERTVRITGTVLDRDGTPVRGAVVESWKSSGGQRVAAPPPVTVDDDGRFVLDVVPDCEHRMRARLGDRQTQSVCIQMYRSKDHEVTLRFPGAYSVRGLLLDGNGDRVVQERVRLLGASKGTVGGFATSDDHGRFEFLLTSGGAFDLVTGAKGWSAAHVRIELSHAVRRRTVTLRLKPLQIVSGRVVDERGVAQPGVHLGLSYTGKRNRVLRAISHSNRELPRGKTGVGGRFRFLAPAGQRYVIGYRTASSVYVKKQEVVPPATNIVVVVREDDGRGFRIAGRVTRAADGRPVTQFTLELVSYSSTGGGSASVIARGGKDGRFDVGPFRTSRRYSLMVHAPGLAETVVGPFEPILGRRNVDITMQRPGTVVCTVRRWDGVAVARCRTVLARFEGYNPFGRAWQRRTDDKGKSELTEVAPGRYHVHAVPIGELLEPAKEDVVVEPGQETRVELTLKRRKD